MRSHPMAALGLAVIAASALLLGQKRGQGGGRRCCPNPDSCLCELNRTIHADILRAVRALPERFDPRGRLP